MHRFRAPTPSPTTIGYPRKIRVAALPIAETAALWAGIDEGIFADHGLRSRCCPPRAARRRSPR